MLKKAIYTLLICALTGANLSAQSWSKTITSNSLAIANGFGPLGGPYQKLSSFQVHPDAITINSENVKSKYDLGAVYSIYSMDNNLDYGNISFPASFNSLWLKVVDENGKLLLNKGIEMPSTFSYTSQNPPLGQGAVGHLLSVNSLAYYGEDILVLTGAMTSANNYTPSADRFTTMIVGTYDLKTDIFQFEYIESTTKTVYYPNGSTFQMRINSEGMGVNYMEDNKYFQAIGKTTNYLDADPDMKNPIAWIVDIDPTNGSIKTVQTEGFNFDFVPTEITEGADLAGYDSFVVGAYRPDTPQSTSCGTSGSATFGLGVFDFKYHLGTNQTRIGNFRIAYSDEFESSRSFPNRIYRPTIFKDEYQDVFVAYTKYNGLGAEYTVFAGLGIDLVNTPSYYSLVTYSSKGNFINSGFQMTDKDRYVQLSLKLVDNNLVSGRDNYTSLGIVNLNKTNLGDPLLNMKELYSHDDPKNNIRNFRNITAVSSNISRGYFDYYFADGHFIDTDKTRAHIYGIKTQDFDNVCENDLKAEVSPVCFVEETSADYQKWEDMNNSRYSLGKTAQYSNAKVDDLNDRIDDCVEYDTNAQRRSAAIEATTPTNGYTTVYTLGNNVFQFEKGDALITEMALYDLSGRLILTAQNENRVDLGDLPKSLYVVRLAFDDQTTSVEKIMAR